MLRTCAYLGATGLHQNRGIEDLMRYEILEAGMDEYLNGPAPEAALPAPNKLQRLSDAQAYALALYIYSLRPPPNPNKLDMAAKRGQKIFEREGCTVLTASSWIEFNHVLAGNSPDIIFLDVNLPSIKGNRLSEVLKSQSNKKDIPIVLISDLPEKSLEEMFPSSGANAWMRKPLTRDKMVDMINRYVQ